MRSEIRTIEFSRDELQWTVRLLDTFYGLDETALPPEISRWLESNVDNNAKATLSISGCFVHLDQALNDMGCQKENWLGRTLLLLTYIMRNSRQIRNLVSSSLFNGLLALDMARLDDFINSVSPGETLVIQGKGKSVTLSNYSDWIRKELIQPYLDTHKPEEDSFGVSAKTTIKDPRIPLIIWGTYRLLLGSEGVHQTTDGFCDLILAMLKLQEIIPEKTDRDRDWVRDELKQIKTNPRISQAL